MSAEVCCRTTSQAARNKHPNCMRRLHEQGVPWDEDTCGVAADRGDLESLTYAHEHGCPWYDATTYWAAEQGELACLVYAHEHGCPWHEDTACIAALEQNWSCWTYATLNGARWVSRVLECHTENGWWERIKYAMDTNRPINAVELLRIAAKNGRLDVLKLLLTLEDAAWEFWSTFSENYLPRSENDRIHVLQLRLKWQLKEAKATVDLKPCNK